jgi:glycosyltransferase involved in cell wall biosynthesis
MPVNTKRKLSVCIVSPNSSRTIVGGIGFHSRVLAEGFAALGHDVTIIGVGTNEEPEVRNAWGTAVSLKVPWLPGVPNSLRGAAALQAYLRSNAHKFDVVEASNWPGHCAFIANSYGKYVVRLVTPSIKDGAETWRGFVAHRLEQNGVRKATRVITSCNYMLGVANSVYGISPEGVAVIPFGVPDVPRALALPPSERVRFLFVGRAEGRKGTDSLIKALHELALRGTDVEVTLVGTHIERFLERHMDLKPLWARIVAAFGEKLRTLGWLTDEQKDKEYAMAHWLVHPARFESFGLTIIEAMRAGTPSIVSNGGALPETAGWSTANIVYGSAEDHHALADTLETCARSGAAHALALREVSRETYLRHFTVDKFVGKTLEVYETVARAAPTSPHAEVA